MDCTYEKVSRCTKEILLETSSNNDENQTPNSKSYYQMRQTSYQIHEEVLFSKLTQKILKKLTSKIFMPSMKR